MYQGLGKRKTSVAKVFLKEGTGQITVNKKSFEDFFSGTINERELIKTPFLLLDLNNKYDVTIFSKGGGINSQLEAIRLAISKALITIDPTYKTILNESNLLNRDSRIKERRKYGLKKARKASQYSKR
jgi:small subunit ribosomal protein S9